MVYVTHDQIEAMTLGERIVVLKDGEIRQIDTPLNVYRKPANKFVAGFIGSPAMNFVPGVREGNGLRTEFCKFDLQSATVATAKSSVTLGLRPEQILVGDAKNGQVGFRLLIDVVEPIGNEMLVYGRAGTLSLVVRCDPKTSIAVDQSVPVHFDPTAVHYFDGENEEALPVS